MALPQKCSQSLGGTVQATRNGFQSMTNESLRSLAFATKLIAIFCAVVVHILVFRGRFTGDPVLDAQDVVPAFLALTPNRCLVSSRASFTSVLLIALFPFRVFFYPHDGDITAVAVIATFAFFAYGPLPLSFILSRMRIQRGVRFLYA